MCTPIFEVIEHFSFLTFLGLHRAKWLDFWLFPQCQICGFQLSQVSSVYFAVSFWTPAVLLSSLQLILSLLGFFFTPLISQFGEISRGIEGKLLCLIGLVHPEVCVIFTVLIFNDCIFYPLIILYSFTCFLKYRWLPVYCYCNPAKKTIFLVINIIKNFKKNLSCW